MKIIVTGIFLVFFFQAWGEDAKPITNSIPKIKTAKTRAPDLDFSQDIESPEPVQQLGPVMAISSHSWVYWSLGLTAAAGGMTFMLWDKSPPAKTVKSVQVFTDAPN